jgi:predicted aspartyl protease
MKWWLCLALFLAATDSGAQAPIASSGPVATLAPAGAEVPAPALPEVLVSTPEPRYVAPTRRDRIGRIWAPVYMNGQGPFRLVLDTGANRSAVIASVAEALGDKARSTSTIRLRGVTGTAVVPAINVDRMEIGDLVLEPVLLPVVPDVFGGAEGVLGNEGLRDKRIVIDFRHDSITVKRSRRERPGYGFQTLPITMMETHLLVVNILIGGVPAKAIIDTGAADSLGNVALLEALKRREPDEEGTEIVGVTLDVEYGSRVQMPAMLLRGIRIRGAAMTFGDVQIFQHWHMTKEPAILLGMDVLGALDQIIIDYKSRELHILTGSS